MCLKLLKASEPKIADHDIICYKVLLLHIKSFGTFYETPYANCVVNDDVIKGKLNFKPWPEIRITCPMKEVSQGFIHTYAFLDDAEYARMWLEESTYHYDIFKCIIPKGVRFYEGECFAGPDPTPGFASLELKFIEKI